MQTPHRSEFFGLCFSLSFMGRRTQNTGCFVLPPRVNVAFPLSQTASPERFGASSLGHRGMSSVIPFVWLLDSLLQSIIPMKSAKNAMRLM